MGTQFTPGPWKFEPHAFYGHNIDGEVMPFGYVSEDKLAAPIFGLEDVLGRPVEELEASARLIAAAPDLLASVLELIGPLEKASSALQSQGFVLDEFAQAAFDRARAAIRKARGDQ